MNIGKWNIKTRDLNKIKFNAVDFDEKDYIEYDVWLDDANYVHNLEAMSKFFDEHFGCKMLQCTNYKDINNNDIYELNKVKITIDEKEDSIAYVVYLNSDFVFKIISGDLLNYDILPVSYIIDTTSAKIEIIDKFDFENIKE